jgi:hypothetical protein
VDAHQDSLDEREEFIALIRLHTARRLARPNGVAVAKISIAKNIVCHV